MIAVEYRKNIPRYLALRALGRRMPGLCTGPLGLISLRDMPEPSLPGPAWVRVRPTLSGICGSDLAVIGAKGSPYFSPLTSTPFVLGHEVVGRIVELGADVTGLAVGGRVVLQPALGCQVREIEPPCAACAAGQIGLCRNVTRGRISAGIQTGFCRDTGGAWSESFVAHGSQVYKVPDSLDDEVAVMVEPFACALHAVLRTVPPSATLSTEHPALSTACPARGPQSSVLVLGCGAIGLLVIAALRAVGSRARVIAVAKYDHQREHALRLGATEVLPFDGDVGTRYRRLAAMLAADLHRPEIGKPTVVGGADLTFDCVASSTTIDDACRFTRAGGTLVLVGMPAIPSGVDWTALWYKELVVQASYAYGRECFAGRSIATFDLVLELLAGTQTHPIPQLPDLLRPLTKSRFALRDYRLALRAAFHSGAAQSVKTILVGPG